MLTESKAITNFHVSLPHRRRVTVSSETNPFNEINYLLAGRVGMSAEQIYYFRRARHAKETNYLSNFVLGFFLPLNL